MKNLDEMLEFFVRPDNLPDVLQIVQYAEQIRERVENDFWEDFEKRLREQKPSSLPIKATWRQNHYFDWKKRSIYSLPSWYYPGLDCFVQPISENAQGIKYRIEISWENIGYGFMWIRTEEPNFETLCQTNKAIGKIQEFLKSERQGDIDSKPNPSWLWYENWKRNPFKDVAETWTWYAQKREDSWYSEKAQEFWGFVGQTYEMVIQANEELRQFKG